MLEAYSTLVKVLFNLKHDNLYKSQLSLASWLSCVYFSLHIDFFDCSEMSGRVCVSIFQRASSHTLCHFSSRTAFRLLHLRSSEKSRKWSEGQRHFSTHQDLDFQLSWVQINSILRSSEQVMHYMSFSV